MTTSTAMTTIDANKSIYNINDNVIFVLKFSFINPMDVSTFCDLAQDILYDKQGSSGYFRIAPKEQSHLNADFIEAIGEEANYKEHYNRKDNEIIAAFIIYETDPDVPLTDELTIFPEELIKLCEHTKASVIEQLDIANMY
jgi:hypothetical protein